MTSIEAPVSLVRRYSVTGSPVERVPKGSTETFVIWDVQAVRIVAAKHKQILRRFISIGSSLNKDSHFFLFMLCCPAIGGPSIALKYTKGVLCRFFVIN